ncbi:MAG: glycosyltransferase [Proteobacteria bacterium]|nr:glycosyltransferase [Pseudomonadota bacterium]
MAFSVLMSVYTGTTAADLAACLKSLATQELPPDEIVIVEDGLILEDTAEHIRIATSSLPIKSIPFSSNRGLGPALHDGLLSCTHELVARVDTDDRCLGRRFSLQVKFLYSNPNIAVVGGGLREWYGTPKKKIGKIRNGPTNPEAITDYARKRNPLNHPTVMFRKSAVLESGNYQPCYLFEDYFLWVRMIQAGHRLVNLPDILVETDVDFDYFRRRGGVKYCLSEFAFAQKLCRLGFLSAKDVAFFVASRLPFRMIPWRLRPFFYQTFLRLPYF